MTVSVETEKNWPIPADLGEKGRVAAEVILELLEEKDLTYHGGGGRFYSPREWEDRGEEYGRRSALIITHDGGDHAVALNIDYGAYNVMEELAERLRAHGMYLEQCTSWYSAVYPI